MDDETWKKVLKVGAPGNIKIKLGVFFVFTIFFSIYLTPHICPSKLSTDNM